MGGDVVTVFNNQIALCNGVGEVECGHVGVNYVGCVWYINNERGVLSIAGDVSGITTKEGWSSVEPKVDKGVLVRNRWESSSILDRCVCGALIGCNQRSTVWPVVRGIGRRVNSKNDIYFTLRLNQWVQRDVLSVLTTIDQGELGRLGDAGVVVVEIERVGLPEILAYELYII